MTLEDEVEVRQAYLVESLRARTRTAKKEGGSFAIGRAEGPNLSLSLSVFPSGFSKGVLVE